MKPGQVYDGFWIFNYNKWIKTQNNNDLRIKRAKTQIILLQFAFRKVLILDELDKSMHPNLVKFIANLFRNPGINKAGAQLIVTTDETGILTYIRLMSFRLERLRIYKKAT